MSQLVHHDGQQVHFVCGGNCNTFRKFGIVPRRRIDKPAIAGRIVVETATSLTLRRAEGAEDIILRADIDSVQATAKSLMPEGLESQLSQQEVADVIAYLQKAVKAKPSLPTS